MAHAVEQARASSAHLETRPAYAGQAAGAPFGIGVARFGELPFLARLQRRGFARDGGYGLPTCLTLWLLPRLVLLVARDVAGTPVGMIIADRRGGSTPHGRVLNLCVDPRHRRQGAGRALLAAIEAAISVPAWVLLVDQKNLGAIALYERCGYRNVGMEPDYYGQHCHALVMQKQLTGG